MPNLARGGSVDAVSRRIPTGVVLAASGALHAYLSIAVCGLAARPLQDSPSNYILWLPRVGGACGVHRRRLDSRSWLEHARRPRPTNGRCCAPCHPSTVGTPSGRLHFANLLPARGGRLRSSVATVVTRGPESSPGTGASDVSSLVGRLASRVNTRAGPHFSARLSFLAIPRRSPPARTARPGHRVFWASGSVVGPGNESASCALTVAHPETCFPAQVSAE